MDSQAIGFDGAEIFAPGHDTGIRARAGEFTGDDPANGARSEYADAQSASPIRRFGAS
jgi:hypothetical protein